MNISTLTNIREVLFKVLDEKGGVMFATTNRDRADQWAVSYMCTVAYSSLVVMSFIEDDEINDHTLTWRHVYDPITGEIWNTQLTHYESCQFDTLNDFYGDL